MDLSDGKGLHAMRLTGDVEFCELGMAEDRLRQCDGPDIGEGIHWEGRPAMRVNHADDLG